MQQVACIPRALILATDFLFLLSLFLPPAPLSFSLAGATCAPRNSSFISRVLCSAAAVRPKKFLSRPSARLLSIPPSPSPLPSLACLPPVPPSPPAERKSESDITDLARSIRRLQKFTGTSAKCMRVCEIFLCGMSYCVRRRYLDNGFVRRICNLYIKLTCNKNSLSARKKGGIN